MTFLKFLVAEVTTLGKYLCKIMVSPFTGAFQFYKKYWKILAKVLLVLFPFAALIGTLPRWVLWVEGIGLLGWFLYKRYQRFIAQE